MKIDTSTLEREMERVINQTMSQISQQIKAEQHKLLKNFFKILINKVEQEMYDFYFQITTYFYTSRIPKQYKRHEPLSGSWHGNKIMDGDYGEVGYNLYTPFEFEKTKNAILNMVTGFDFHYVLSNMQSYSPNGFSKRKVFNMVYNEGVRILRTGKNSSTAQPWLDGGFKFHGEFIDVIGAENTNVIALISSNFNINNPRFQAGVIGLLHSYIQKCKKNKNNYPWLNAGVYG